MLAGLPGLPATHAAITVPRVPVEGVERLTTIMTLYLLWTVLLVHLVHVAGAVRHLGCDRKVDGFVGNTGGVLCGEEDVKFPPYLKIDTVVYTDVFNSAQQEELFYVCIWVKTL